MIGLPGRRDAARDAGSYAGVIFGDSRVSAAHLRAGCENGPSPHHKVDLVGA